MKNLENLYSKLDNSKNRIDGVLQDYANDFFALHIQLMSGIKNVRDLFKNGYKIKTVQEYLFQHRNEIHSIKNITPEDEQDPVFVEKSEKLNNLANTLNILGEHINEVEIKKTLEEVKKIIY
ncbi:MAG: hypothetical protein NTX85_01755 [Candidatus Nomurabacteria bacterium]|nr:hypothetical protein [Candidatus Nomurabacteria bacterium]